MLRQGERRYGRLSLAAMPKLRDVVGLRWGIIGMVGKIFFGAIFLALFSVGAIGTLAITTEFFERAGIQLVFDDGLLAPLIEQYLLFRDTVVLPEISIFLSWFGIDIDLWMIDAVTLFYFVNLGTGVLLTVPRALALTFFFKGPFEIGESLQSMPPGTKGLTLLAMVLFGPLVGAFILLGTVIGSGIIVVLGLVIAFVVINPVGIVILLIALLVVLVFAPTSFLAVAGFMGLAIVVGYIALGIKNVVDDGYLTGGLDLTDFCRESVGMTIAALWIGIVVVFSLLLLDAIWVLTVLNVVL